jgi:hypothetical protein
MLVTINESKIKCMMTCLFVQFKVFSLPHFLPEALSLPENSYLTN